MLLDHYTPREQAVDSMQAEAFQRIVCSIGAYRENTMTMRQRGRRVPPERAPVRTQQSARNLPWNLQIVEAERQATIESLKERPSTSQVLELVDNARAGAA
jgi:hypothetical protein